MIRIFKCIVLALVITSCGSEEKKSTKIEYPEKTSFSSESTDLRDSMESGKLVYNSLCITCHMANGQGAPKVFPPLAQSDYLKNNQEESGRMK